MEEPSTSVEISASNEGFVTVSSNRDTKRRCTVTMVEDRVPSPPTKNRFDGLNPDQATQDEEVQASQPSASRIPPIILHTKERWVQTTNELRRRNLNFSKAKTTKEGIVISPSSEDDYRGITALFREQQMPFHTYMLQTEKPLKIVIRGIPEPVDPKDVQEDLISRGFPVNSVSRMRRGRERAPMPLVMVELNKSEAAKAIFDLKSVLSLRVL